MKLNNRLNRINLQVIRDLKTSRARSFVKIDFLQQGSGILKRLNWSDTAIAFDF